MSGATNSTISDNQGVGTITNDEGAVTISINDVIFINDTATTEIYALSLRDALPISQTITVNAQTADDTATTADSDYTGVGSTLLTFSPGVTTQHFHVLVNGDTKRAPHD